MKFFFWFVLGLIAAAPQWQVGQRSFTPPASGPSCTPFTDNFAGSGALSASWTQTSASGFVPLVRASGFAVPNTSGSIALASITGCTFSSTSQYIQAQVVLPTSSTYNSLCLNVTVTGTGVCYFPDFDLIYTIVLGSPTASVASCSAITSGDTVKIAVSGTTYTATDVTTSATLCSGTSLGASGSPALMVDWSHGGSNGQKMTNVQAD